MSQENVEIVGSAFQALARADVPAFLERFDPNAEWWDRDDALNPSVYRGHAGVQALIRGVVEAFSEWQTQAAGIIDAGDCVVVPVRHVGRGRSSGAPIEQTEVYVCRLREGQIVELREYSDMGTALKVVGLAE